MTALHGEGPPTPGSHRGAARGAAGSSIVCRDVVKRYRSAQALSGVSLEVAAGSVFGFLGPNGAGKSTLVKILTGLVRGWSGEARVLGGIPGARDVQQRIGYLPELFRFPGWLTGTELLDYHSRLAGVAGNSGPLLDLVGLAAAGDRRIGEYSKGMQQRLGLAQALVGDPAVVFLDEPTSALDPLGRLDVRDVLLELRQRGTTVFLNSHLLTEVEKVCDHVAVIDRGRIVAQGVTADLLRGARAVIRVGPLDPALLQRVTAAAQQAVAGLPPLGGHTDLGAAETATDGYVPPVSLREVTYAQGALSVAVASEAEVPALVRAVVEAGAPVYEAGLDRRSLEDAFVALVGDHEVAS